MSYEGIMYIGKNASKRLHINILIMRALIMRTLTVLSYIAHIIGPRKMYVAVWTLTIWNFACVQGEPGVTGKPGDADKEQCLLGGISS